MSPQEAIDYCQGLPKEELVFVLRSQDYFAPATVLVWATMCLSQGSLDPEIHAKFAPTRAKGVRAADLVERMRLRQREHGCKIPD